MYFPFLIVLLVILALIFSIVLLFLPSFLPSHLQQVSERVGLAQLSIEFASLAALLLAAWEFKQAQQKPKLQLWMDPYQQNKPTGKFVKNLDGQEYSVQLGTGTVYTFPFVLLIDNNGSASARWIKVTLELEDNEFVMKDLIIKKTTFIRQSRNHVSGKWIPDGRELEANKHVFHGGDDYVVYSRPNNIALPREWMDELGVFELQVPLSQNEDLQRFKLEVNCYIEADGFPRKKQSLVFRLNNTSRSIQDAPLAD